MDYREEFKGDCTGRIEVGATRSHDIHTTFTPKTDIANCGPRQSWSVRSPEHTFVGHVSRDP